MPVYGVDSGAQATPIVFVASGGAPIYIVGGLHAFDVSGVGLLTSLTEVSAALASDPSADVTMLRDYNASRDGVFAASPLGTTSATAYTGTFDGAGYTIRNFSLTDTSATPGLEDGLFGTVGNNSGIGTVKNLTVSGTLTQTAWERETIGGDGRYLLGTTIGGVVASLRGTLDNVTSNMTVYGSSSGGQHGGLVGRNEQWPDKTIIEITKDNPGVVTVTAHGMATGTRVHIKDVAGMTQVNGETYTITSLTANTFSIGVDTSAYSVYTSGGVAMGAGTVKNCTSNATVVISRECYNTYQSPLVASNRGLIDNCVTNSSAVTTAPQGYAPTPVVADYAAGWTGTASISGTTLNVTFTDLGAMAVDLYIYAPNSVPGAIIADGTQVITDLGGGNWEVSISQTVTSRDLMAADGDTDSFLTTGSWMGAIAGDNGLPGAGDSPTSLIQNCTSYAALNNSDNLNSANYTGGIVGYQGDGTTEDCRAYGAVNGGNSCGGIVGFNAISTAVVQRCGASGDITATVSNIGGIVGQNYGTVDESWASGDVSGTTSVGGAIGLLRDTGVATSIFSFGNATGTSGVGGLIGQAIAGSSINEAYSLGVPTAPSRVGGSIAIRAAGVTATDVYWDLDSSGNATGVGSGDATDVTGLDDTAMLTDSLASLGFGAEWSRGVITPDYPVLNTAPTPANPTIVLDPPLSVSFSSSNTSVDSATITMPTGIKAGDYAYLISFAQNNTNSAPALVSVTDTSASPSWTLVNQQFSSATGRACRISAYVKILLGTETTVTSMALASRGQTMSVMVFRPSDAAVGDTWTRLNARVVINGAAVGNVAQSMASGTSPCMVVGCAVYDGGTPPTNQSSLGDQIVSGGDTEDVSDDVYAVVATSASGVVSRATYHVSNTGAASSTYTGDTDAGGVAVICVNVSVS